MDKFERIRRLRDHYEASLDEAERLRDEYHREIVKLHRSGMSLREIADGLGISHQRVHQIVTPHEEPRRSGKRRAAVAGWTIAALLLVVAGGALFLGRPPAAPVTASSVSPIAAPTCTVPGVNGLQRFLRNVGCNGAQQTSSVRTYAIGCDPPPFRLNLTGSASPNVSTTTSTCDGIVAMDPRTGRVLSVLHASHAIEISRSASQAGSVPSSAATGSPAS